MPGGMIGRYGDLWGGYFLQAVLRGSDWNVSFGEPLVDHRRNPHDYLTDLREEYWGMLLTDWMLAHLKAYTNTTPGHTLTDMVARYKHLSHWLLRHMLGNIPVWAPGAVKDFLYTTATTMSEWAHACHYADLVFTASKDPS